LAGDKVVEKKKATTTKTKGETMSPRSNIKPQISPKGEKGSDG
jgi:hypothetical protein